MIRRHGGNRVRPIAIAIAGVACGVIPIAAGILIFGSIALGSSRAGKTHRVSSDVAVDYLPDVEALDVARRIMELDGYVLDDWLPQRDGRTESPDGRRDEYVARNAFDPKQGYILFHNPKMNEQRMVHLTLESNDTIAGYVWVPK